MKGSHPGAKLFVGKGGCFRRRFHHALGEKEAGGRAALPIFREIMLHAYQRELVGPVPPFPREIEDRIDHYLARQAALKAARDDPPPRDPPPE